MLYYIIPLIWLAAFLISSPAIYIQKVVTIPGYGPVCIEFWPAPFDPIESPKQYTVALFAILYVAPLAMMMTVYSVIGRRLSGGTRKKSTFVAEAKNKYAMKYNPGNECREPEVMKIEREATSKNISAPPKINTFQRKKVIRMLIALVSAFAICWLPVYILQFLIFFHPSYIRCLQLMPEWAYALVFFLQYANSAINPLLYFTFSTVYRKGIQASFKGITGHTGNTVDVRHSNNIPSKMTSIVCD